MSRKAERDERDYEDYREDQREREREEAGDRCPKCGEFCCDHPEAPANKPRPPRRSQRNEARTVDDPHDNKQCTCTKNEHGQTTSIEPSKSCPIHGHLVDARLRRRAAPDGIIPDLNGDEPEAEPTHDVDDEYSRRLFPFRGVQVAVMVKDWKESWDATELAGLIQAVQSTGGGKVVVTEFDDGSDSSWLVLHPDSLHIDPDDQEVVNYLSGGDEDEEPEDEPDEDLEDEFQDDKFNRDSSRQAVDAYTDESDDWNDFIQFCTEENLNALDQSSVDVYADVMDISEDARESLRADVREAVQDAVDYIDGTPEDGPRMGKTASGNIYEDFENYFSGDILRRFNKELEDYGDGLRLDYQEFQRAASDRVAECQSPEEALEWLQALASFQPYAEWDEWDAAHTIEDETGIRNPDPALLTEAKAMWERFIPGSEGTFMDYQPVEDELPRNDRALDQAETDFLMERDRMSFKTSSGEEIGDFESARHLLIQAMEEDQRQVNDEAARNFEAAIADVETWTGPDTIFVDTKTGAAEFWIKQADDDGDCECGHRLNQHDPRSRRCEYGCTDAQCLGQQGTDRLSRRKQVRARTAQKCDKCGEDNDKVRTYTYSVDGKPKELHAECADNLNRDHDVKKKG